MIGATGFPNQFDITGNLCPFAFGADAPMAVKLCVLAVVDVTAAEQFIDLAVGNDHFTLCLGTDHGLLHHLITLNTTAVIGEAADERCHTLEIRKFLTLLSHGDGAVGIHMDAGILFNDLPLEVQIFNTVRHGIQVRHGAHSGITATGSRQRTGFNGLFIRKTRLSEMYVYITKAGKNSISGIVKTSQLRRQCHKILNQISCVKLSLHLLFSFPYSAKKPCRSRQDSKRKIAFADHSKRSSFLFR